MPDTHLPMWTCPKCRHHFVSANLWHSCGRYELDDHFAGTDPIVRALFDRFRKLVEACGPVTVYAQKTRIVFQARVRFATVMTRKRWITGGLWLPRRVDDPRFGRVETFNRGTVGHTFRVTEMNQLDRSFARLVREAYGVGCQEHLR